MKKLLAMLGVGGLFLACLTGCPSPTSAPTTTTTTTTTTKPTTKETTKDTTKETTKETTKTAESKTHEGKFVSYKEEKLTIKGKDDKTHEFKVGKEVKAMSGDKEVKWDDIKKDADVTVTEKDGSATKVEVKKEKEAAPPEVKDTKIEGKYVKHDKDTLTLKVDDKDKDFDVKGIKVMIDGKDGKWDDVKKDAMVTVMEKDGKVTKVDVKTK